MNHIAKTILVALTATFLGSLTTSAFAAGAQDTQWQKDHPRREQVNNRLENQDKRIKDETKEGDMSKAKAARLHQQDRSIRKEERSMAAQNGGHITKHEQKTLDQQENAVSKKIGE